MTRADRLTLVRQLAAQGLSQRQIAGRLGVSKDTVRRDLERIAAEGEPGDEPPVDTADPTAPQVSGDASPEPASVGAPPGEPVAQPPDPHAGIDVSQCAGLRHDLALLAQTGTSAEALVYQAVIAMAHAYRRALADGDIAPGVPFVAHSMRLAPLPHRAVSVEAG
ncbi:helix-turn-helix domain-containing protein [Streptomyces chartreusis]|uniref:helix-turn-helix domain-containing protein n=1 Tax=Streptomyces chartreusis TaxID=1969 RepID=UPI0038229DF9